MELIPYEQFARLRLEQFCDDASEIVFLDNWEFMGGMWVGEAIEFTAFLRPEARPDELASIEVSCTALPSEVSHTILDAVRLPVRLGMSFEQLTSLLGAPKETQRFVADRKSYDFTVGTQFPYQVSCTVHDAEGLIYVVIIRRDVLSTIYSP